MSEIRFSIKAYLPKGKITLVAEPEATEVSIPDGDEIEIVMESGQHPSLLEISLDNDGMPVVQVWPGDGEVRYEKDGLNIFL